MFHQGGASKALACVFVCLAAAGVHAQQSAAASSPGSAASAAAPDALESYRLLAISSSEGVAVLRAPSGKMITLTLGASLPGLRARLTQVLIDRLQFDIAAANGAHEGAWMMRGATPDAPVVIQRWSGRMPPATPTVKRSVIPLSAASAASASK